MKRPRDRRRRRRQAATLVTGRYVVAQLVSRGTRRANSHATVQPTIIPTQAQITETSVVIHRATTLLTTTPDDIPPMVR